MLSPALISARTGLARSSLLLRATTALPLRASASTPAAFSTTTSTLTKKPHKAKPAPTRPCPACSAPIPFPTSPCVSCSALIAIPGGLSLHSLLDVSVPVPLDPKSPTGGGFDVPAELATLPAHGFKLDARDLRNRMLKRQAALHPDRHGGTELAAELSGRVNKAYETLADPLRRVDYILKQYGKDIAEQDGVADHDLLMEVLDARESLEAASDENEIEELRQDNHAKVTRVVRKITTALSKEPPALDEAKTLAVELKYWIGLENAAKEKL